MPENQNITAIILAGGKSSRMGQNKAILPFRGKRLIDHTVDMFKQMTTNIIIAGNDINYGIKNTVQVPDFFADIGPLGGIYSGLLASKTQVNIIAACDTPLLKSELFFWLLTFACKYKVVIPVVNGITQPITGVFNRDLLHVYKQNIKKGLYSPPRIMRSINYKQVVCNEQFDWFSDDMFYNINTQADYLKIKK